MREAVDGTPPDASICLPTSTYQGWARSTNILISVVMAADPDAQWFIAGGDDYYPDLSKSAEEIGVQCHNHFYVADDSPNPLRGTGTFGVMQPTGDRWQEGLCFTCRGHGQEVYPMGLNRIPCPDCSGTGRQAVIDRIAGSPWMGREWCRLMYNGFGPMYNGYYHNFADEELQNVARKLGVFWQRRDLTHDHRHWAKTSTTGWAGVPEWMQRINLPAKSDWDRSQALFTARKAGGFPGHEPLLL